MPNVEGRPFAWLAVFGGLLSLGFAAGGGCGEWAPSTSTAWGLGLLLVLIGTTVSVAASLFQANEDVLRRALKIGASLAVATVACVVLGAASFVVAVSFSSGTCFG